MASLETNIRPKKQPWLNIKTYIVVPNTSSISSMQGFWTLCSSLWCTESGCQSYSHLLPLIFSINGFVKELSSHIKWDYHQLLMISWRIIALAWWHTPQCSCFSTVIGWLQTGKYSLTSGNLSKEVPTTWSQNIFQSWQSIGEHLSCSWPSAELFCKFFSKLWKILYNIWDMVWRE